MPKEESATIVGTGTDVIAIRRIDEAWARFGRRFLERVYTPREISYCLRGQSHPVQVQRLAGRFAAKEAVMKSLGVGPGRAPWREVEILRRPGQAPQVYLQGRAAACAQEIGADRIWISITHERELALAVAVAAGWDGNRRQSRGDANPSV